MKTTELAEVLVVGAGPVGMTAAILLASHGVRVLVIEKNSGTADEPKAISLDDESLRVYQRAGISEAVLKVIVPGTGTTYFGADGAELFHGRSTVPFRFGFPFKNPFAQPDLERVLRQALEASSLIELRFSTELVSFVDSADGITAVVSRDGRSEEIHATYVLGADGGRSRVRAIADIQMIGRSHDEVWLVVDCIDDFHHQRYGMHHGDPVRPHVIVPGLDGRCRYEFYLNPHEAGASSDPPFELIERLLAPYRPITPEQIERAVAYKFHGLVAESWKKGNAFLLGDAAHMMPPFAGQGLNSGIRDAANLTWKLAAVLKEQRADELLDTYEIERRPHAAAVVRSSEKLGRVVMTTNQRLAAFRDAAIRKAMSTAEGRNYFEGMRYRPSTRLSAGLVLDLDSQSLVGFSIGQPRVFDFRRHVVAPLDHLLGEGWAVIGIDIGDDPSGDLWLGAIEAFSPLGCTFIDVPFDDTVSARRAEVEIAIDVDGRLYSEFESIRGSFITIRPDRVVAAVSSPAGIVSDAERLLAGLRGQPVTSAS